MPISGSAWHCSRRIGQSAAELLRRLIDAAEEEAGRARGLSPLADVR